MNRRSRNPSDSSIPSIIVTSPTPAPRDDMVNTQSSARSSTGEIRNVIEADIVSYIITAGILTYIVWRLALVHLQITVILYIMGAVHWTELFSIDLPDTMTKKICTALLVL
ncbi:hypothetical protein HBH82_027740 [Parastagonospora nodorum]|nr:hypothetical protein HBH82_027740 [Parastagonospora nodorum]KAH5460372.1 hypothetical protein HBI30_031000 [Parastagonospora nodorum]